MTENEKKRVLVTTSHRGVFFGKLVEDNGKTVTLEGCRNCLYWSADVRGFLGLSVTGPTSDCRIGPTAESVVLRDVTSVTKCSDEATKAWESAEWKS